MKKKSYLLMLAIVASCITMTACSKSERFDLGNVTTIEANSLFDNSAHDQTKESEAS